MSQVFSHLTAMGLAALACLAADVSAQIGSSARVGRDPWTALGAGQVRRLDLGSSLPASTPLTLTSLRFPTAQAISSGTGTFRFAETKCEFIAEARAQHSFRNPGSPTVGRMVGSVIWSLFSSVPTDAVVCGRIQIPHIARFQGFSQARVEIIDLATGTSFRPHRDNPLTLIGYLAELGDTWSFEWPVQLGSQPREFEIRVSALSQDNNRFAIDEIRAGCSVELEVVERAQHPIGILGNACGVEATGFTTAYEDQLSIDSFRELVLSASASQTADAYFLVLGTTNPGVVLPPLGCALLTDAALVIPVTPLPSGVVELRTRLPLANSPFVARGQFLAATLNGPAIDWATSQGFRIEL